jgi:hypothetical protein
MQREAMEFDVLIVGGGPAFLFDRVKKLASRASTFSPDRVDALVWAFSHLLVEQMASEGFFEWSRQKAASLKPQPVPPPKPVYAPGSVEYEMQQREQGNS